MCMYMFIDIVCMYICMHVCMYAFCLHYNHYANMFNSRPIYLYIYL